MAGMAMAAVGTEPRVIDEGRLAEAWAAAPGATFEAPGYPAALAGRGDDVCLAVGYSIDDQGRTGDFSVLRQWSSADETDAGYWDAYAQSVASAISQWRFTPREGVAPRLTYTVATVSFTGLSGADAVAPNCRVEDLAALLQARKSEYFMAYSLQKREAEAAFRRAESRRIASIVAASAARREPRPTPANR
jgi:hypothetical protein